MTEQYNSQGRYNIYYEGDQKRGEVVKGVLYEGSRISARKQADSQRRILRG